MKFKRLTDETKQSIKRLYFDLEYSVPMICEFLQLDAKTAHYWIRKFGNPRKRSEAQILAHHLGRGTCNARERNGMWRGGRSKTASGYIRIIMPDDGFPAMAKVVGDIFEHRYIMAKALNRPLNSDEIVHHINGIKHDNRLQNLLLTTRNNHPTKTLMKAMQKRIRDLEAQLAQQKLEL